MILCLKYLGLFLSFFDLIFTLVLISLIMVIGSLDIEFVGSNQLMSPTTLSLIFEAKPQHVFCDMILNSQNIMFTTLFFII